MNRETTFGSIVKERRLLLGLTQAELGRRVGCAAITIRKIEADSLRPSVQIAENLAVALNIPEEEHLAFIRLARSERDPSPIPTPEPIPEEIGQEDLSGRSIRGFELGERIGTGGYGVVYRARQATVGRDVAVKIILPKYADRPDFIRRFETEAQLVARLEHPHIVPLYDYWREPGVAYLIMRLLRGGSLEDRLNSGPIDLETILQILGQICAGLYASHQAGVVHRDIKPANILLDDDDNAYLADFGIAKHIGNGKTAEATIEGTVIGSPAYISPEQILAEPVRPQTDIYSMGVVLYELLTGHKPFKGPTPYAYIQQHLNEPLPLLAVAGNGDSSTPETSSGPHIRSISSSGQPIPTALDVVIGRATSKDARERYPDILAMLADLRQAMKPGSTAADMAESQKTEKAPAHVAAMIELPDLENPYKGLRAFTEADAADFFGRQTLIQDLLARLAESNDLSRFLAVVGPSGSGKSSVVRAGLIPALRQGGLPASENWFITEMMPGIHPLEELEAALLRIAINPPKDLLAQLKANERGLLRITRQILPADADVELVLVIDQFEEVFTLVGDEDTRQHFLDSLVTATLDPGSRLRVVTTMRADFTDQPLRYVDFGDLVRQRTEFVLPLMPDELEQAIVGPTERAGLRLEPELVPTIIREIGDQPGTLPLLQYALTELFERREGRRLTLAAYRESGGVLGALARRADELYQGLDESGQEMTRQLFLRLVTLGEGTEDTRRRVLRSELSQLSVVRGQSSVAMDNGQMTIDNIIDQFGRYRLLTFDHDPVTRGPTVEVAHEALLREWTRLRGWLDESRADIRLQRILAAAAKEWLQADRDPGFLLRGSRLDQFEGWADNTDVALTQNERTFLEASMMARQEREAEEEARRQRELDTAQKLAETERQRAEEQTQAAGKLRRRAVFLTGALVIAGILAVAAVVFGQQATQNERAAVAEANLRATAQADAITEANRRATAQANAEAQQGIAVAEAEQRATAQANAEAQQAIAVAEAQQRATAQAQTEIERVEAQNVALIAGSQAALAKDDTDTALALAWQAVSLNPDSAAAQAQLSEVAYTPGTIRRFVGHTDQVSKIAISPDGRMVLSASDDDSLIMWDIETGEILKQLGGHTTDVRGVVFSPDGHMAASVSDEMAILWDMPTGQIIRQFNGHEGPIKIIAFSPDGQSIVTGDWGDDAILNQWDVETGEIMQRFESNTSRVLGLEFTPDGSAILYGSTDDGILRLMDIQTGQIIHEMSVDLGTGAGALRAIAISPDGLTGISGFANFGILLWDLSTGALLQSHALEEGAFSIAFHPNNGTVLVGNRSNNLLVLDPQTGEILQTFTGHNENVFDVEIHPNGRYAVSASIDKTLRLWDLERGNVIRRFAEPGKELAWEVDLSPDGQTALSALTDGSVTLWDVGTGEVIHQFKDDQPVTSVTYSPDGQTALISTGYEFAQKIEPGHLILWDVETGEVIRQFVGHPYTVWDVDFSSDGKRAVSSGSGAMIILWDVETGQEIRRFDDYFEDSPWSLEAFWDVEFSPDASTILASYGKGPLMVWDVETGEEIKQLVGHGDLGGGVGVIFSADGRRAVSGGWDTQAILWDMQTGGIIRRFTNHVGPIGEVRFTPDERLLLGGSGDGTNSLWDVETGEEIRRYGNGWVISSAFNPDGRQALAGYRNGAVELWRIDSTLDELLEWTQANRYIPEVTCEQRELYRIEPLCESEE